jgi:hypothetical protein
MNPAQPLFAAPPGQKNDEAMIDEADKKARKIFYLSLTNLSHLLYYAYNAGYFLYNYGYIES